MHAAAHDEALRFDHFEIRPGGRMLLVDGHSVAVGARAFDLLLALAQRHDQLVTKQQLLDAVWPGVVVEEHNIAAQISSLRKLLGARRIATVPGRGYRLAARPIDAPAREQGPTAAPRHNLPEQRTRFIGRETALADLARLVPQSRLLTLTGIGGSGKTRLALQFGKARLPDFADGVWFVDLAPLAEPARVVAACAAALPLGKEFEAPSADALAAYLAERQALIVLDNCEHVRAGAAALADALLARPGRSRIVATSREALGVVGEQIYPVRSLSLPATADLDEVRAADAVRVFVDRARLVLPEFEVAAANAAAIAAICRRLDGIALAIELAAARVTMLSVFDIAARLDDRFRLLTGGSAGRQQTLLATMQWSEELLEPAEAQLLHRLAVFAGGCTLQAATAVAQAADDYTTLALLTALHDKSLLAVERGADDGKRPRYSMLETVRQYAQQRLEQSGEAEATRTRHAEFFLALAEDAGPHLRGPQQSAWMARLRDEQENLVAVMMWCTAGHADPQWSLRLMAATGQYWVFNDVELGSRLALDALQRDRTAAASMTRCQVLLDLAAMFMFRGRGDAGLPHARDALAMAQRLGDSERQAKALNAIGVCLRPGDDEAALRHHAQARDLAQAEGHAIPLASALNNIAIIEWGQGRLASAAAGLRQALHLSRARGDIRVTLIELHNLVRVQVDAGQHDEAHACAVEAELLLREVAEDALRFELLEVTACLASSVGNHEVAARFFGAGVQPLEDAGYRRPREDTVQLARLSALSRRAIGDAAFARAEAAGRALGPRAAMLELRQWLERHA